MDGMYNIHVVFRLKASSLENAAQHVHRRCSKWLGEPSPTQHEGRWFLPGTLVNFTMDPEQAAVQIPFDFIIVSPAMIPPYSNVFMPTNKPTTLQMGRKEVETLPATEETATDAAA